MDKAQVEGQWGFARMAFVNVRRQIEQIPEDKLDFRPSPDERSVRELAVHMHRYLTVITETVLAVTPVAPAEPESVTRDELLSWMDSQVAKGYENLRHITEAQLNQTFEAWGETLSGWQLLSLVPTEIIHHRGQLITYLQMLGIEPVPAHDDETSDETTATR